jgi:hypothetical protein
MPVERKGRSHGHRRSTLVLRLLAQGIKANNTVLTWKGYA